MEASTTASPDVQMDHLSTSMPPNERRKFLRRLFVTLSPHELREFRSWIDQVDFSNDILSNLPLEIAHQVLGYLPLHQCFRIRRVSKKWFSMLSAPQTVEHLLRFWYSKAEAKLEVPKGLTASAVSSSRAAQVDAYRSGSAFSRMKVDFRTTGYSSTYPSSITKIAYADGYIAWISTRHRLYCLHLESGTRKHWPTPDGEANTHVAMSSSILVATTNAGICHVLTFSDDNNQNFPLVSTTVEKITASGNNVAILHSHSPSDSMLAEMTLWTLKSMTSVQCRVRLQGLPFGQASQHDIKIMIGTDTDYLVLFERRFNPPGFYFTRFSFAGQIQSQGYLEGPDTATFSRHSESLIPSDVGGCGTIWSYCRSHETYEPGLRYAELIRVQYDPQQNQLQLKTNRITGWRWPRNLSGLFFWKDIAYCREGSTSRLWIVDLSNNEINFATNMSTEEDSRLDQAAELMRSYYRQEGLWEPSFLGDENFLISINDDSFLAWCFNRDTKLEKERKRFAKYRHDEMQKRLKQCRDAHAIASSRIPRIKKGFTNLLQFFAALPNNTSTPM